jgi:putative membrane protein
VPEAPADPGRRPGPAAPARREPLVLLALGLGLLALSGVGPRDRLTWWLEVAPVLLAAPLLVATYRRFPLTPLAYRLLLVHAAVLVLGGHYTYAEVPLGFWLQRRLGLARNPYDRIGHFAQGFVPAILAREILLRRTPLRPGAWLWTLVSAVALAISALYELVEWWAALATGEAASAFLGTQGDPWDTQWDMCLALIGSVVAQLLLSRRHDRELARRRGGPEPA